jgi:uncharacterized protein
MTEAAAKRIATLDVVRGVAVMGILLANLPAFALPHAAYFSPLAWGGTSTADVIAWFTTFVLIEGKMRGLFSFLFGASMLLIVDRARATGQSAAAVHYPRMAVLFAIGVAHLYLIWWGDILAHYALIGAVAFLFTRLQTRALAAWGLGFLGLSFLSGLAGYMALADSAARDTPQAIATWVDFGRGFGIPPRAELEAELAAMRGSWIDNVRWRWVHATDPFSFLKFGAMQTLSAMLLGMAAFRSGLLTGAWDRARLKRWAGLCLAIGLGGYVVLGVLTLTHGFDQRFVFLGSIVASEPFRVLSIIGYAGLAVLLVRPGGWLTERIAAVGRAAFTNYLGTSILVSGIFCGWGLGLFGNVSRAAIYLVAPMVWLIMLAWSKPWLERFQYGPLEWAWRSLARWQVQPMRKRVIAAEA